MVLLSTGEYGFPQAEETDLEARVRKRYGDAEARSFRRAASRDRERPVLEEQKDKDYMRSVSFPWAKSILTDRLSSLHDWAALTGHEPHLAQAMFKRVLERFVKLVEEEVEAERVNATFTQRATTDIYSIGLEVLTRVSERGLVDAKAAIMNGEMDTEIDRLLLPTFSVKALVEKDQSLCYTDRLKPSPHVLNTGGHSTTTVTFTDLGHRKFFMRKNRHDVTGERVILHLTGWDMRETFTDEDMEGSVRRNPKMQYDIKLDMAVTSSSGHHMVSFDMDPQENVAGYKCFDILRRCTTLRIESSSVDRQMPTPYMIENGGLPHGRVRLHFFRGCKPTSTGPVSVSTAEATSGYDTAACLNTVTHDVAGLLVSVAVQATRKTSRDHKRIQVQAGVGSGFPAQVATMIGNMFGTPVTVLELELMPSVEAHHAFMRRRLAILKETATVEAMMAVGGLDFLEPSMRVASFLQSCYQSIQSGAVDESDMKVMEALYKLNAAVEIYNDLILHYSPYEEVRSETKIDPRVLDDLMLTVATAVPGRRRQQVLLRVSEVASVQIAPMFEVRSDASHSYQEYEFPGPSEVQEMMESAFSFGQKIMETLSYASSEHGNSPQYRGEFHLPTADMISTMMRSGDEFGLYHDFSNLLPHGTPETRLMPRTSSDPTARRRVPQRRRGDGDQHLVMQPSGAYGLAEESYFMIEQPGSSESHGSVPVGVPVEPAFQPYIEPVD